MPKNVKSVLILGFSIVLLTGLAFAVALPSPSEFSQVHEGSDESLVRIFDQSHKYNIGYPQKKVSQYISECCADQSDVERLLKESGFRLIYRQWSEDEVNASSFKGGVHFDQTIMGVRRPGLRRFWDIFAIYEVSVFLDDGRVVRVLARVDRTMP